MFHRSVHTGLGLRSANGVRCWQFAIWMCTRFTYIGFKHCYQLGRGYPEESVTCRLSASWPKAEVLATSVSKLSLQILKGIQLRSVVKDHKE
jgi:hypothetical protein